MTSENEFSRRRFIEAVAALGSIGLASCTGASRQSSKLWAADRSSGTLPPRGASAPVGLISLTVKVPILGMRVSSWTGTLNWTSRL